MDRLKANDISKIIMVNAPVISSLEDTYYFTVTRPNLEKNKYETSIWMGQGTEYWPLTKGPADTCPSLSPGENLIAFSSRRNNEENVGVYIVKKGGEPWELARFKYSASIVGWSPDSSMIYVIATSFLDKEQRPYNERERLVVGRLPAWFNGMGWVFDRVNSLYKITYPGGVIERLSEKKEQVVTAAVAKNRNLIAYAVARNDLEPYIHRLIVLDLETGTETTLLEDYTIASIEWSPDGDKLAIRASRRPRGVFSHYHIYVIDLESKEPNCLTCGMDLNTINTINSDVRGPNCRKNLYWAEDGNIYFLVHKAGSTHIYKVSPEYSEIIHVLGQENAVIDEFYVSTRGQLQILYTVMTPTMPKELYMWTESDGILKITSFNEWIENLNLPEPSKYTITGSEGEPIDFWILLPGERPDCEKCIPWILYIHGGPKTSYGYGFIYEFQLLASNGIAVIYGNPHGSDGYSEEFADLREKFGTVDYEDLMLIADNAPEVEPYLDPERAGIAGGSYGGWMTNYIITRTRRFKTAITQRSCSNWVSFYGASDIGWYFTRDVTGSPPWDNPGSYIKISPIFHADKIKTPTLIIHSLEDYRCPLDQALQLYTALKINNVRTKLVLFPGENHDLSRTGTPKRKIARLETILEWLKQSFNPK